MLMAGAMLVTAASFLVFMLSPSSWVEISAGVVVAETRLRHFVAVS
jgi:hypothetical protein